MKQLKEILGDIVDSWAGGIFIFIVGGIFLFGNYISFYTLYSFTNIFKKYYLFKIYDTL